MTTISHLDFTNAMFWAQKQLQQERAQLERARATAAKHPGNTDAQESLNYWEKAAPETEARLARFTAACNACTEHSF